MNWLLWSAIGTGAWLLLKPRTASATTLPDGSTFNPVTGVTTHPDGSRTFDADAPNSPSAAVPFQGNGSPSAGPVDISDPSVVAVNQGGKPAAPLGGSQPLPGGGTFNTSTGVTTHPDGSRTLPDGSTFDPKTGITTHPDGTRTFDADAPNSPSLAVPASVPTTKTVITSGRKYFVTQIAPGTFRVVLAGDPSVFQVLTKSGTLQSGGDAAKLAQLKTDETQFPASLSA